MKLEPALINDFVVFLNKQEKKRNKNLIELDDFDKDEPRTLLFNEKDVITFFKIPPNNKKQITEVINKLEAISLGEYSFLFDKFLPAKTMTMTPNNTTKDSPLLNSLLTTYAFDAKVESDLIKDFKSLAARKSKKNQSKVLEEIKEEMRSQKCLLFVSVAKQLLNLCIPYFKNSALLSLDDFFQFAYLGFENALANFDVTKNVKFITHATWYTMQSLTKNFRNLNFLIRIPASFYSFNKKVSTIINSIIIKHPEFENFSELELYNNEKFLDLFFDEAKKQKLFSSAKMSSDQKIKMIKDIKKKTCNANGMSFDKMVSDDTKNNFTSFISEDEHCIEEKDYIFENDFASLAQTLTDLFPQNILHYLIASNLSCIDKEIKLAFPLYFAALSKETTYIVKSNKGTFFQLKSLFFK